MAGNRLFRKLTQKGFFPVHVAEVGVYLPETSNVYDFTLAGVRSTLVEPDPGSVAMIRAHFAGRNNVSVHPVAVYDTGGTLELVKRGASTYAAVIENSPAVVNDEYRLQEADRFVVSAVTFDTIDDGTIDVLSVDIEGGEWFAIKHMVSRPAVISLETHGALYKNPYMAEINAWMRENGYSLWYRDKSDSVYVKTNVFPITLIDKARLAAASAGSCFTSIRKHAKRVLLGRSSSLRFRAQRRTDK